MIWEMPNPDERKEKTFEVVASLGKAIFQKNFEVIKEASISKIVWIANIFLFFSVDEEDNQSLMDFNKI